MNDQTAPKSRVTLSGEYLESQLSGQSLFQALNQIPGVNFTNSDPYGTSGGNLRIRGFDGSRVSVTFDGVPLNDSGNYALFTNQMLDSELVDRVDVNLGTTDVDSPTASATGGTVAYKTKKPTDEFGGEVVVSGGEFDYKRAFVRLDSGEFGPWGTKAFIAGSYQNYDKFKGPGELEKKQVNAVIRQDFENENFISRRVSTTTRIATRSIAPPARPTTRCSAATTTTSTCARATPRPPASSTTRTASPVADARRRLLDHRQPGQYRRAAPTSTACASTRRTPATFASSRCGTSARRSILTFDPSYQYTLANGGGTTTIAETASPTSSDVRVRGNSSAPGVDLNGDGDLLDTVRFYTPNTTNTNRYGATASLIWDLTDTQRMRFAYTYDRAQHRQTAQWGPMDFADGAA